MPKTVRGFIRGGNWNNGALAGAFTLNLNNAPSNANTNIGFRCARYAFKRFSARIRSPHFVPTDPDLPAGAGIAEKAYGHTPFSFGREISGPYLRRVPYFFERMLTVGPVGPHTEHD